MKKLNEEQTETIKDTIRSIVDSRITEMVSYDLDGSDFIERVIDNLPTDFNLDFDIRQGETTQYIDSELYHKFLDNVTDSIFKDLEFH
jgi:hypothetical protein